MFKKSDIHHHLNRLRDQERMAGGSVMSEVHKILNDDLFIEKRILENLGHYNASFHLLEEEDLDPNDLFSLPQIKQICVIYRLKFLDSKFYKPEIPYISLLKIKGLNDRFTKELKDFKIVAPAECFLDLNGTGDSILFAKTVHNNYYLVHRWGNTLPWYRRLKYWPLRNFERLFLTVICFTLLVALSLPIRWVTLDHHASYWSGYRAAAFFHLLIFNMGVTVYVTFAFTKNFSSSVWNRLHDFD